MEQDIRELGVVHEQDLEAVLEKAGLLEQLRNGSLKCRFCGTIITVDNLHSLLPQPDGFSLTCDKPQCIQALSSYLAEKNKSKVE